MNIYIDEDIIFIIEKFINNKNIIKIFDLIKKVKSKKN
jgi:hypothetical protein